MDRTDTATRPARSATPAHSQAPSARPAPARPPRPKRDTLLFALGVVALLALPLIVPAWRLLVLRPLWLDELHTLLLARDLPGPLLVERLARGADFNPPLLFLIDSALLRILPGLPEQLILRLTSIVAVAACAILLYRVSREHVGGLAAAIGTLVVLSHPALVAQLHEARFYALWLLLTVFVATSVEALVQRPQSRARFARLALAVALTSMTHYFGVISLACIGLAALFDRRVRANFRRLAFAMLLGLLPLAAWSPIYLKQRRVLSVATWVPGADIDTLIPFMNGYYAWWPLAFVLIAGAAYEALARRGDPDERPPLGVAQVALLGLLAMPVAIMAFSVVVQPALVPRYALPAIAGFACIAALGVARLPVRVKQLMLAGVVVLHGWALSHRMPDVRKWAADVRGRREAALHVAGEARPVVTLDRNVLYPVALPAGTPALPLRYLVVPTDVLREYVAARQDPPLSSDHLIVERDAALAHTGLFRFPAVIRLDSLRRAPAFFLVTDERAGSWFADLFPGYRSCQVRPYLVLFSASAGGPAAGESTTQSCDLPEGRAVSRR